MTLNELIDQLKEAEDLEAAQLLQQQAKEIEQLNFVLKNLTLATNKKINELEEEIEHLKNKVQYWKGLHR
jgi:polyhydroxyalkanoate synthesis regulator phasin